MARIQQYMEKAIHEAKVSAQADQSCNAEYETRDARFCLRARSPSSRETASSPSCGPFVERIGNWGALQRLGLADALETDDAGRARHLLQGQELWDFSLVDPDNRRWSVDFARRSELLAGLEAEVAKGAERCSCDSQAS